MNEANQQTVQTVTGPLSVDDLGYIQIHEHLLIDSPPFSMSGKTVSDRGAYESDIRLDNLYDVRRNHSRVDGSLTSEEDAVEDLAEYKALGGTTLVDVTPIGLGRDPLGLARISAATGVNVVMGTGFYTHEAHPAMIATASGEEIEELFVSELDYGNDGTNIRAGLIGEIGMSWPPHPDEQKVLAAASRAQQRTGAALMVHSGRGKEAPLTHLHDVIKSGGDPERTIISHLERTIPVESAILELAAAGCYLSFDMFGQESSYYPRNPSVDMPNDGRRIDLLIALIDAGYQDRILCSQDLARKTSLAKFGGEGRAHILKRVIPAMRRKGIPDATIRVITQENPARILARRS